MTIDSRGPRFGAAITTVVLATVLLLAADGSIAQRASGKPSRSDVLAAVGSVLGEGVPS